jgi:HEAT repeat protein
MLVQRFSVVAHPTVETLAFLESAYKESHARAERFATAYALGAAAGNLARAGADHRAEAKEFAATLERDLGRARTPDEKKELLGALGNVGLASDTPVILPYTADSSSEVRRAAAYALRKIDTPDARAALVTLAADGDDAVEESALQALGDGSMGPEDWRALAQTMTSAARPPRSEGALLALLARNTDDGEPVAAILRTMLERNDADKPMQARIRHVLAQVQ